MRRKELRDFYSTGRYAHFQPTPPCFDFTAEMSMSKTFMKCFPGNMFLHVYIIKIASFFMSSPSLNKKEKQSVLICHSSDHVKKRSNVRIHPLIAPAKNTSFLHILYVHLLRPLTASSHPFHRLCLIPLHLIHSTHLTMRPQLAVT